VTAQVGRKDAELFEQGSRPVGSGQRKREFVRWFSDGERGYAQELWKLASVRLKYQEVSAQYGHLKVWREGLEVAIKIKGSQGRPRIESVKPEHPFTAISPASEVHANHNEALNSSIRRRCSAYRRRQNHYAKNSEGVTAGDHGTAVDSQLD
jgi:hypothetical protein